MSISVFISYAVETEEHNKRVVDFSNKLRKAGIDVSIFFDDMKLGDRFQVFMEKIEDSDFTLMICTPEYKKKAKSRMGGVGYEWNIITTSVVSVFDDRKFIPILFSGDWETSVPIWARGKMGIDYRINSVSEFNKLINAFSEYETQKMCEVIDITGEVRAKDNTDIPFKEKAEHMIMITREDGTEEIVEVVAYFQLTDEPEKEFLIYTKNQKDDCGNVMIFTSRVINTDDYTTELVDVSESDWEKVKQVIQEMGKE